jgi:hypothetical protein
MVAPEAGIQESWMALGTAWLSRQIELVRPPHGIVYAAGFAWQMEKEPAWAGRAVLADDIFVERSSA